MKQKSMKGMQKRSENELEMQKALSEVQQEARSDEDDDAEWYRQEVGQNPEKDLFDDVPGSHNKRKLSSVGPAHKRKKVEGGFKYKTKIEINSRTQNKFGKRKQKFPKDSVQKIQFHKRKVFGSKISMKNKKH